MALPCQVIGGEREVRRRRQSARFVSEERAQFGDSLRESLSGKVSSTFKGSEFNFRRLD